MASCETITTTNEARLSSLLSLTEIKGFREKLKYLSKTTDKLLENINKAALRSRAKRKSGGGDKQSGRNTSSRDSKSPRSPRYCGGESEYRERPSSSEKKGKCITKSYGEFERSYDIGLDASTCMCGDSECGNLLEIQQQYQEQSREVANQKQDRHRHAGGASHENVYRNKKAYSEKSSQYKDALRYQKDKILEENVKCSDDFDAEEDSRYCPGESETEMRGPTIRYSARGEDDAYLSEDVFENVRIGEEVSYESFPDTHEKMAPTRTSDTYHRKSAGALKSSGRSSKSEKKNTFVQCAAGVCEDCQEYYHSSMPECKHAVIDPQNLRYSGGESEFDQKRIPKRVSKRDKYEAANSDEISVELNCYGLDEDKYHVARTKTSQKKQKRKHSQSRQTGGGSNKKSGKENAKPQSNRYSMQQEKKNRKQATKRFEKSSKRERSLGGAGRDDTCKMSRGGHFEKNYRDLAPEPILQLVSSIVDTNVRTLKLNKAPRGLTLTETNVRDVKSVQSITFNYRLGECSDDESRYSADSTRQSAGSLTPVLGQKPSLRKLNRLNARKAKYIKQRIPPLSARNTLQRGAWKPPTKPSYPASESSPRSCQYGVPLKGECGKQYVHDYECLCRRQNVPYKPIRKPIKRCIDNEVQPCPFYSGKQRFGADAYSILSSAESKCESILQTKYLASDPSTVTLSCYNYGEEVSRDVSSCYCRACLMDVKGSDTAAEKATFRPPNQNVCPSKETGDTKRQFSPDRRWSRTGSNKSVEMIAEQVVCAVKPVASEGRVSPIENKGSENRQTERSTGRRTCRDRESRCRRPLEPHIISAVSCSAYKPKAVLSCGSFQEKKPPNICICPLCGLKHTPKDPTEKFVSPGSQQANVCRSKSALPSCTSRASTCADKTSSRASIKSCNCDLCKRDKLQSKKTCSRSPSRKSSSCSKRSAPLAPPSVKATASNVYFSWSVSKKPSTCSIPCACESSYGAVPRKDKSQVANSCTRRSEQGSSKRTHCSCCKCRTRSASYEKSAKRQYDSDELSELCRCRTPAYSLSCKSSKRSQTAQEKSSVATICSSKRGKRKVTALSNCSCSFCTQRCAPYTASITGQRTCDDRKQKQSNANANRCRWCPEPPNGAQKSDRHAASICSRKDAQSPCNPTQQYGSTTASMKGSRCGERPKERSPTGRFKCKCNQKEMLPAKVLSVKPLSRASSCLCVSCKCGKRFLKQPPSWACTCDKPKIPTPNICLCQPETPAPAQKKDILVCDICKCDFSPEPAIKSPHPVECVCVECLCPDESDEYGRQYTSQGEIYRPPSADTFLSEIVEKCPCPDCSKYRAITGGHHVRDVKQPKPSVQRERSRSRSRSTSRRDSKRTCRSRSRSRSRSQSRSRSRRSKRSRRSRESSRSRRSSRSRKSNQSRRSSKGRGSRCSSKSSRARRPSSPHSKQSPPYGSEASVQRQPSTSKSEKQRPAKEKTGSEISATASKTEEKTQSEISAAKDKTSNTSDIKSDVIGQEEKKSNVGEETTENDIKDKQVVSDVKSKSEISTALSKASSAKEQISEKSEIKSEDDVTKADVPDDHVTEADDAKADVPEADALKTDVSEAVLPKADGPEAYVPKAEITEAVVPEGEEAPRAEGGASEGVSERALDEETDGEIASVDEEKFEAAVEELEQEDLAEKLSEEEDYQEIPETVEEVKADEVSEPVKEETISEKVEEGPLENGAEATEGDQAAISNITPEDEALPLQENEKQTEKEADKVLDPEAEEQLKEVKEKKINDSPLSKCSCPLHRDGSKYKRKPCICCTCFSSNGLQEASQTSYSCSCSTQTESFHSISGTSSHTSSGTTTESSEETLISPIEQVTKPLTAPSGSRGSKASSRRTCKGVCSVSRGSAKEVMSDCGEPVPSIYCGSRSSKTRSYRSAAENYAGICSAGKGSVKDALPGGSGCRTVKGTREGVCSTGKGSVKDAMSDNGEPHRSTHSGSRGSKASSRRTVPGLCEGVCSINKANTKEESEELPTPGFSKDSDEFKDSGDSREIRSTDDDMCNDLCPGGESASEVICDGVLQAEFHSGDSVCDPVECTGNVDPSLGLSSDEIPCKSSSDQICTSDEIAAQNIEGETPSKPVSPCASPCVCEIVAQNIKGETASKSISPCASPCVCGKGDFTQKTPKGIPPLKDSREMSCLTTSESCHITSLLTISSIDGAKRLEKEKEVGMVLVPHVAEDKETEAHMQRGDSRIVDAKIQKSSKLSSDVVAGVCPNNCGCADCPFLTMKPCKDDSSYILQRPQKQDSFTRKKCLPPPPDFLTSKSSDISCSEALDQIRNILCGVRNKSQAGNVRCTCPIPNAITSSCAILPLVLNEEEIDNSSLMHDEESLVRDKKKIYKQRKIQQFLKRLLPIFDTRGYFDKFD